MKYERLVDVPLNFSSTNNIRKCSTMALLKLVNNSQKKLIISLNNESGKQHLVIDRVSK